MNFQGWFELARAPTKANADEVRAFYKNLAGVPPKLNAGHSHACEVTWDGEEQYFSISNFTKITGVPTHEGLKLLNKQSWPRNSSESFKAVFPGLKVSKKSQSTESLSLTLRICHARSEERRVGKECRL